MKPLLEIHNLHARVENLEILKGIELNLDEGRIHAVMGRNGSGKSTLANVLMGSPFYEVTDGTILFKGRNITDEDTTTRARRGMFLGFQYPVELAGVRVYDFLKTLHKTKTGEAIKPKEFRAMLSGLMDVLDMTPDVMGRGLNEGFSGGEKKKLEILQLLLLKPELAILDETDSGLDVDALRTVSFGIKRAAEQGTRVLIITHYTRILDYLSPDRVHILLNGKIVASDGPELAKKIDDQGYEWLGGAR